jgi:hypothetical protein
MTLSTGSTSIPYGASLRIGYRPYGSTGPYTYISHLATYEELPYTYTLASGIWEVEYSATCQSCTPGNFSSPQTTVVSG